MKPSEAIALAQKGDDFEGPDTSLPLPFPYFVTHESVAQNRGIC